MAAKALVVAGFGSAVAVADLVVAWAVGMLMVGRRLIAPASALDLLHLHGAQIALTVGWALLGMAALKLDHTEITRADQIPVGLDWTKSFNSRWG